MLKNPGHPWKPLDDEGLGYLSVYFSDPMSRYPVRDITRRADNKSDPNIETGTYGLFSTCEPSMRNRVVQDGAATIMFITTPRPKGGRFLTGYYHVAWYTEGARGAANRDYALAADTIRFIDPIAISTLPAQLSESCSVPFRQTKRLDADEVVQLRAICDEVDDKTDRYLDEVSRIERFAASQTGYSYPSWGREHGFSWVDATDYYFDPKMLPIAEVPNSTKTRRWRCHGCDFVITSVALLKKCPVCNTSASLAPER